MARAFPNDSDGTYDSNDFHHFLDIVLCLSDRGKIHRMFSIIRTRGILERTAVQCQTSFLLGIVKSFTSSTTGQYSITCVCEIAAQSFCVVKLDYSSS